MRELSNHETASVSGAGIFRSIGGGIGEFLGGMVDSGYHFLTGKDIPSPLAPSAKVVGSAIGGFIGSVLGLNFSSAMQAVTDGFKGIGALLSAGVADIGGFFKPAAPAAPAGGK